MLQLIVLSLFQADELLDLLGAARLTGLDTLFARGRHEALGSDSLEGLLCQALGISRQKEWPIAPISMKQAGGETGEEAYPTSKAARSSQIFATGISLDKPHTVLRSLEPPPFPPRPGGKVCEPIDWRICGDQDPPPAE